MERKTLCAVLIGTVAALILTACGPAETGRDWTYATGAGHLLVEADTRGGLVPPDAAAGHIPDFRLYGDGHVIWSEENASGAIAVWQSHLSEQQIRHLLDWMDEQGFFQMDEYYTVENAPFDMPSSCIRVSLQNEAYGVCEYYDGAPEAFDEIYQRLRAGAGVSDSEPFEPETGWVTARRVEASPEAGIAWPEVLSPALSAIGDGTWVEGETLDFVWRARLEHSPAILFEELGDVYQVVIQVPGLMPEAPSAP